MNINQLYKIKNTSVLVYGDYMVDKYIHGDVSRISPEAPVPVLHVTKKEWKFGGAGNVAVNLLSLDAKVYAVGFTGEDEDGSWMKNALDKRGADVAYLHQSQQIQTIIKTRITSRNQQFIRLDEERTDPVTEDMETQILNELPDIIRKVDAVILSDYGKGSVTNRISKEIIRMCKSRTIPIIVDPKGTDYGKYSGSTICKPNEKELALVTGSALRDDSDVEKAGMILKEQSEIDNLVISRSEKGIMLLDAEGTCMNFPTRIQEVIDVTGAGDTVVAMLAVAAAIDIPLKDSCKLANVAAAIVCSKFGAASVSLDELIRNVISWHTEKEKICYDLDELKNILNAVKEQGKTVVFTNGCFDLLHAGHLYSFEQAKQFGDVLVVAVNSDASVRRLKGDTRPIVDEMNRMQMVNALQYVDYVTLMDDDDPSRILSVLQPDIVVKGRDWEGKYMPEREIIESYGGTFRFLDSREGLSTTEVINKIQRTL